MMFDDLIAMMGKKRLLHVVSWVSGGIAVFLLFCSISMDSWLFTVERENVEWANGSYLIKLHSGLWRVCKQNIFLPNVGTNTMWNVSWLVQEYHSINCAYIPYFRVRQKEAGELKPTESILYEMRPAAFFPLTGIVMLCVGGTLSFLARCDHRTQKLAFIGGGSNIVSGILTLIGIVLYVGSVSQAFDSTTGPLTTETRYFYSYGAAFRLCIVAFVLSEFSGVFSIYLFLAELRHTYQTQKTLHKNSKDLLLKDHPTFGDSGYFANSVSTVVHLPPQIPTANTSIVQISDVENGILTYNKMENSKDSLYHRKSVTDKFAVNAKSNSVQSNHIGDSSRVKVISYAHLANDKQDIKETNVMSPRNMISIPNSPSSSNSDFEKSIRNIPSKRRKIITPATRSVSNLRWMDRTPFGRSARSAVNIRDEVEIPDIPRGPNRRHRFQNLEPTVGYECCRECERIRSKQRTNSIARSSIIKFHKSISSSSSFPTDNAEYSLSSDISSIVDVKSPHRLLKKCYNDIVPSEAMRTPYHHYGLNQKSNHALTKHRGVETSTLCNAQKSDEISSECSHSEIIPGKRPTTSIPNLEWLDSSKEELPEVCRCNKSTRLPIKVPSDDEGEERSTIISSQATYSPRPIHNIAGLNVVQSSKSLPDRQQSQRSLTKSNHVPSHQKITSV